MDALVPIALNPFIAEYYKFVKKESRIHGKQVWLKYYTKFTRGLLAYRA